MQVDDVAVAGVVSVAQERTGVTPDKGDRTLTRRNVGIAGALFAFAIGVFLALQHKFGINPVGVSPYPHWVYQAWSLLHGRWDVALPGNMTDVHLWHGKSYLAYPPLPAMLLLPFVAVFRLGTSDILFTATMAALNLSVLFLLFEQARAIGWSRRTTLENVLWAVLLYFGSISLWLALGGRVWFTAQIVTVTFIQLALLAGLARQYVWSAACLGLAVLGRGPVAVAIVYILYLAWDDAGRNPQLGSFISSLRRRAPDWGAFPWRRLLPVVAVFCVALVAYAARDFFVFGSPLETGYGLTLKQYYPDFNGGVLSLSYVPTTFFQYFFTFPHVTVLNAIAGHVRIDMLNDGEIVAPFVTTPLFLLLFARNHKPFAGRAMLWLPIVLLLLAALAFYGNGYAQFGARYLFEAYPFAFLLLLLSDVRTDWRFVLLGLIGIAINVAGAYQFWTHLPIVI